MSRVLLTTWELRLALHTFMLYTHIHGHSMLRVCAMCLLCEHNVAID